MRGRPRKYDPVTMLPIVEKAIAAGLFLEQLPHLLGIAKETLYKWADEREPTYAGEEFADSISRLKAARDARLLQNAWRQIEGNQEKNAETSMTIFALKNCLGWRDRSEITTDNVNRNIVINATEVPSRENQYDDNV